MVRDLWLQKDVGHANSHYTATNVEAHGTVVLKVSKDMSKDH